MSTSKTGRDYQRWCAGMLADLYPGCAIHDQRPVSKFIPTLNRWVSQRNDILGCIDIVCIAPGMMPLFIQCTTHKSFNEKLKALATVPWPLEYCDVHVWLKRGPGRTAIRRLAMAGGGYVLVPMGEIQKRKYVPA